MIWHFLFQHLVEMQQNVRSSLKLRLLPYLIAVMFVDKDYRGVAENSLQIVDFTTISIPIVDDDLAEGVETFFGELVVRSSTQNFSVIIAIEILDDEGLLYYRFLHNRIP